MVVPNNHEVFLLKNDHFEVFWGYHHLRKHPYIHRNKLKFERSYLLISKNVDLTVSLLNLQSYSGR